jgi:hypothetical protein
MKLIPACFALVFSILLYSCAREKETFDDRDVKPELLQEYIPLEPGKYIIYRLDSTVFIQLGRGEEVRSYQEKHLIQGVVTDNLGRTSYRVNRYIRDLAGRENWRQNGTYFITPLSTRVEVIDNNQRIINLAVPIKQGYSWKGNSYLPADLYNETGDFGINNWDFTIQKTEESVVSNGKTFNEVITVERINEANLPDTIAVANNKASIAANLGNVLITGAPTDTVIISAAPPTVPYLNLMIYNRTYQPLVLNNIVIPARKTRSFEYENREWVFGSRDSVGNRMDTVLLDLPSGRKGYVVDKYARNVGLIYSEFVLWTSNPSYVDSTTYKIGTSVRREILEHN